MTSLFSLNKKFTPFISAFCIASTLLLSAIPRVALGEPRNFEKNAIAYVWENEPNYSESKEVFLNAFVKCYNQIPLEVLIMSSREEMVQWLNNVFEETYIDHTKAKNSLWLSAKIEDKTIGFLVIDIRKNPEEIYLAELAVDPAYQGLGIATSMIRSLFEQFPECNKFTLITRRANEGAKSLYNALGFVPTSYTHEGCSPEIYCGFEFHPNQKQ